MRAHLPLLLLASALVAGCVGTPTDPDGRDPDGDSSDVLTLTSANYNALILQGSRPSLVEFYSPGCGACAAMAPIVESLATRYKDRVVVGQVNASVETSLSHDYGIAYVPTFLFVRGAERERIVGAVSEAELVAAIERLLAAGS